MSYDKAMRVLGWISLFGVSMALASRLKEWGKDALKDGDLDASEAVLLALPIEDAINDAVYVPGKRIEVTIKVVDDEA